MLVDIGVLLEAEILRLFGLFRLPSTVARREAVETFQEGSSRFPQKDPGRCEGMTVGEAAHGIRRSREQG